MGTNNIISKAQRSFQPVKAQRKMRYLIFLLSEAQRKFRNELFDSIEAQRNSAIAERYFRTKLERNLTSAIEISQHNANTAFFAILDRKRVNNLLNKPKIYKYYDGKGATLSSMYGIALLTEKNFESATNFEGFFPQRNFRNVSKQKIKAQRNLRNCGGCALPTSTSAFC